MTEQINMIKHTEEVHVINSALFTVTRNLSCKTKNILNSMCSCVGQGVQDFEETQLYRHGCKQPLHVSGLQSRKKALYTFLTAQYLWRTRNGV